MIQKILSIVAVVSFLLIGAVTTHAQQPATEPTPTPSIVQYDLAFPGMLPDHSLYKLKVLRDKLNTFNNNLLLESLVLYLGFQF